MAFCTKCGAAVAETAAFCPACGSPQTVTSTSGPLPGHPAIPPPATTQPQMGENVTAALSYSLGWLTGLIFYFVDRRPFVRFHAAQSIVVFGGLHVVLFALGAFFGLSWLTGGYVGFSFGLGLYRLIDLLAFVLWIVLMIKAYQGQRFRVPLAADIAESVFGKS
jgi:uncharacterized membrane protein